MNKTGLHLVIICISLVAITSGVVLSSYMLSRFLLKIQHSTEKSITVKGVAEKMIVSDLAAFTVSISATGKSRAEGYVALEKAKNMSAEQKKKLIDKLTADMKRAAKDLDFETAALIRDKIRRLM